MRNQLSRSCLAEVEAQLLEVVALLERHHESEFAIDLLEIVCKDCKGQLSIQMLNGISRLGLLLHERGDHKRANVYLRQAWSQRSLLDDEAERRTGWANAISLSYTKHYPEAKTILDILSALGPSHSWPYKRPSQDAHCTHTILCWRVPVCCSNLQRSLYSLQTSNPLSQRIQHSTTSRLSSEACASKTSKKSMSKQNMYGRQYTRSEKRSREKLPQGNY